MTRRENERERERERSRYDTTEDRIMTIDKKTYRLSILSCIHHVLVLALALSLPSRRKCRKKSINKLNIKKMKKKNKY